MAVPTKLISTSIGFQDAAGNLVVSGFLRLQLSQNAEVTSGGGQVTTQPLWLPLTALAKITSQAIWFNDELSPSGTVYSAQLFGSNGVLLIQDLGYWSITGASADLSAMVPAMANVSYSGAVLLTPAGNQTITTGNLTLATGNLVTTSGNLSIGGTSAFTGTATGTKFVGTTISGQSNSAVQVSGAGTVGVGWNNTNGAADQKWADATLSTTSWLLRFVNDANSVGSTIMSVARGALSAVGAMAFGAGGGVQTLFTSTDTIVGKATTDQMSNKNFTGAGGANTLEFLNAQGAAGALTGNAADQTVYTFTVPANTVGPGKGIRVKVMYLKNVGTVSTTYKLIIGAVTIESNAYVVSAANNQFEMWEIDIFNNAGVQNAQFWMAQEVIFDTAATRVRMNAGTSAVDFTASQAAKFTFNVAATDQVTPKFWSVELIQ